MDEFLRRRSLLMAALALLPVAALVAFWSDALQASAGTLMRIVWWYVVAGRRG